MLSIVLLSTPPDVSWFSLISDSQNKKSPLKKQKKTKQNCLWFAWPVKKLFSIIIITSRCGVPTLQSRCFCYFFNFRVRISRSDFSPFFIILNVYILELICSSVDVHGHVIFNPFRVHYIAQTYFYFILLFLFVSTLICDSRSLVF